MEISQWVSASGWILENSQQSHITVLLSMLKKHHHHDHHPQHKHYQKKKPAPRWHIQKFCFLKKKKNPTPKQNTNTKVCSLLRRSLVLEGYWIFLFPGKTAKVFSFQTEKSPILHMTTKGLFEFGSGTVCRFHLDWASPAQSHKGWAKLLPKSLPPAAQGHS